MKSWWGKETDQNISVRSLTLLCDGVGIVWSTTTRTRVSTAIAVTFSVKCFNPLKLYHLPGNIFNNNFSHRKQIVRQLWTQYVEGICDNPMILKSRLTVTQGHWKRNRWVDHTRLTISRVIGRWILSWLWKVGQRSLNVIEISAIRKLNCGFLFAFYSNYGRICSRLWDIQCQRMAWP